MLNCTGYAYIFWIPAGDVAAKFKSLNKVEEYNFKYFRSIWFLNKTVGFFMAFIMHCQISLDLAK